MSQNPGGIFIANNVQGRLVKIEVLGRDEDGKFIDEGITVELSTGEFQEIALPVNGTLQVIIKDD